MNRLAKRFMNDGTLIYAWASQKSFRRKDGSGDGDGATSTARSDHETHQFTTDPEARL